MAIIWVFEARLTEVEFEPSYRNADFLEAEPENSHDATSVRNSNPAAEFETAGHRRFDIE